MDQIIIFSIYTLRAACSSLDIRCIVTMALDEYNPSLKRTSSLIRRRSFRGGTGRDDRGWTMLHIFARSGDLKQVGV